MSIIGAPHANMSTQYAYEYPGCGNGVHSKMVAASGFSQYVYNS